MEIIKKRIHMNYQKGKAEQTITLDEDFNVPDSKPDIVKKIKEHGMVVLEKVRASDDKVIIGGNLNFKFLYGTDEGCASMEGKIPFEETVQLQGTMPQDLIKCNYVLEDLSVHVIHSRKISVKSLITLTVKSDCISEKDLVCNLSSDKLQTLHHPMNVMKLGASKKDIFRIRESVTLPSDRENIGNIVWYELEPQSMDIRACDGELSIKGEISIFCIYESEQMGENAGDSNMKLNFYEDIVPYSGKIELSGCTEEMIPDVSVFVSEINLNARPDDNGEMRILEGELILELFMQAYAEETYDVLMDAYSPEHELIMKKEDAPYESFLIKNNAKCHLNERFKMAESGILQIVHSSGDVHIEDVSSENGLMQVEGSVSVSVVYLKADDADRIGCAVYQIPFHTEMEINSDCTDCIYSAGPGYLQIGAVLTGGGTVDIKCSVGVDIMVMENHKDNVITEIEVKAPDMERIKNLPGLVGYITCEDDTLWDIAKKYCTTQEEIMKLNNLESSAVKPGMKLLLMKYCVCAPSGK